MEDTLIAAAMLLFSPALLFWGERHIDTYLGLAAGIFGAFVMHDYLSANEDQFGLADVYIWLIVALVFLVLLVLGTILRQAAIAVLAGILGSIAARPLIGAIHQDKLDPGVAYVLDVVVVIAFMFMCSFALQMVERPLLIVLTSAMGAYLAVAGVTSLVERQYVYGFSQFGFVAAWVLVFLVGCGVQHFGCRRRREQRELREVREVQISTRLAHGP